PSMERCRTTLGVRKTRRASYTRLPEPYVALEGLMLLATLAEASVERVVLSRLEPPNICEMKCL
ncbi:MAG: hypothetical protein ACKVIN_03575, partial [Longimicrobiales bacterium]